MAMNQRPVDTRGYAGAERNRALSPREVVWARAAYANKEVTPLQLSRMWGMGVESVRRMLRGETYGNVGEQAAREAEAPAGSIEDGGAFERLIAGTVPGGIIEAVPDKEAVVEAFLKGEMPADPFSEV